MGAEIVKHWESDGRGTGVYVTIGQLVKAKKLKRQKGKGGRGSRRRVCSRTPHGTVHACPDRKGAKAKPAKILDNA